MKTDKGDIRRRALALIEADGHRVGTRLAEAAGVSRQVANGYLQGLVRDGLVCAEGTTRARVYTDPEVNAFDRTVVPLRLAQYEGENLVSRSQAKRVANRLERLKRVELDFSSIHDIGQAFADELFRVFANAHRELIIRPLNTEPAVAGMIRRAVALREAQVVATLGPPQVD